MMQSTMPIAENAENDALDLKDVLVALRKKAMSYADALAQAMDERKGLIANLTATQERCSDLLLRDRAQRARIKELEDELLVRRRLEVSSGT